MSPYRWIYHWACDAWPVRRQTYVTFPANGRYQLILIGEQRHIVCEQLAQSRYVNRSGRDSNLRPVGCKSDTLTTTPPLKCRTGKYMIKLAGVENAGTENARPETVIRYSGYSLRRSKMIYVCAQQHTFISSSSSSFYSFIKHINKTSKQDNKSLTLFKYWIWSSFSGPPFSANAFSFSIC